MGLSGAYVAIAEGAEGQTRNPAAVAQKDPRFEHDFNVDFAGTMHFLFPGSVRSQDWDNDVRIVLFVRLQPGLTLDETLCERITTQLRENTTPLHVPKKIIQVEDIPRTISGKISELAVREVIHGRPVKNTEALANPQSLRFYERLPQLRD